MKSVHRILPVMLSLLCVSVAHAVSVRHGYDRPVTIAIDPPPPMPPAGYQAGGMVTIISSVTEAETLSGLTWRVELPPGWSLAKWQSYRFGKSEQLTAEPAAGTADVLEWDWSVVPAISTFMFSYTLNVPAGTAGFQPIRATAKVRQPGAEQVLVVTPDPLMIPKAGDRVIGLWHSADFDGDGCISLPELMRVIEIYNVRYGTVRTGCYNLAMLTVDGFAADPDRSRGALVTLAQYHTADVNHDAKLSLTELLRVIELYNHRTGTVRTGQYHLAAGTEDGFAPGP